MDIERMREFIRLGETQSFTKAAVLSNVSQSSFSRHVADMERELNATLAERSATGIELTEKGRLFFEGCVDIVAAYDALAKKMRASSTVRKCSVVVGGYLRDNWVKNFVYALMSEVSRREEGISLTLGEMQASTSLVELSSYDPIDMLSKGSLDLAITYWPEDAHHDEFAIVPIHREICDIYVPTSSPLLHRSPSVSIEDFQGLNLIFPVSYPAYAQSVICACEQAGFTPTVRRRYGKTFNDVIVARDSRDAFFIARSVKERMLPTEISNLVNIDIQDPQITFRICLVYRRDNDNEGIPAVLDVVRSVASVLGANDLDEAALQFERILPPLD